MIILAYLFLFNPLSAKLSHFKFHPLEFCLATVTHNIRWVKITNIWLFWEHIIFQNLDV